jgi:phosphate transport system substrate-binding protein
MNKIVKAAAITAAALALSAGAFAWNFPWATKNANKLTLSGSTTVLPIAQKAAEVFMKANPSVDVTVKGGGSGVGIASLLDRSTDIGDASRSIKTKEVIQAKSKGITPIGTIIAKDGMAVIVNKSNPLTEISIDQLQAIYSGETKKWSALGGGNSTIVTISRDSSSGTYEVFGELVLRGAKLREDAIMTASNREVAENVKNTEGAIGYVGLAYVSDDVKLIKVEGVIPSDATVNDGSYKLARPLFMYTDGEPTGVAKEFIDYIMSADGQKLVKEVGYVPVK